MAIRKLIVAICLVICVVLPKPELRLPPNRLYIPSADINVGLEYGAEDTSDWQYITDKPDTACVFSWSPKYGDAIVYADHNTQGFANLPCVKVGDTAYITDADGNITRLVCVNSVSGSHYSHYADDGTKLSDYDYIMYTCYGYGDGIWLCMWEEK